MFETDVIQKSDLALLSAYWPEQIFLLLVVVRNLEREIVRVVFLADEHCASERTV